MLLRAGHMGWKNLFHLRDYLRSSLWLVPFIAIPIELATTRLLHHLDSWLGWTLLDLGVSGAQGMLNAIITATLSFVVFTFGSLLVALQIASGQMTPRIIATILVRDNVVRYTTSLFIFTLLFAISALFNWWNFLPPASVYSASPRFSFSLIMLQGSFGRSAS